MTAHVTLDTMVAALNHAQPGDRLRLTIGSTARMYTVVKGQISTRLHLLSPRNVDHRLIVSHSPNRGLWLCNNTGERERNRRVLKLECETRRGDDRELVDLLLFFASHIEAALHPDIDDAEGWRDSWESVDLTRSRVTPLIRQVAALKKNYDSTLETASATETDLRRCREELAKVRQNFTNLDRVLGQLFQALRHQPLTGQGLSELGVKVTPIDVIVEALAAALPRRDQA